MNTGNFLGISQDYGLRDAFLRLKPWANFGRPCRDFRIRALTSAATFLAILCTNPNSRGQGCPRSYFRRLLNPP